MRRLPMLLSLLVVAALVVAVPVALAKTRTVSVKDDFFSKKNIRANKGDTVRFVWRGDSPHNVRFARKSGRPKNCGLRTSGSCRRTFKKTGLFKYVCTIHDGMRGSVRVR